MTVTFPTVFRCGGAARQTSFALSPCTIPKAFRKCNFFGRTIRRKPPLGLIWLLLPLVAALLSSQPLLAQEQPATAYFLVPGAPTTVKLHTHTADFTLGYDGDALILAVDALYRLQNSGTEPTSATFQVVAEPANDAQNLPPNLVVLVAAQPLALTVATGQNQTGQVQLPADGTLDVRLNYSITLGDEPLAALVYTAAPLDQWPGQPSLRVSIAAPEAISSASRLLIQPAGWNYAPDETGAPRIRWLYDPPLPEEPFQFSFIHPATWQSIQAASAAATPGAAPAAFLQLGQFYEELYAAAAAPLRDRFYAQAVAAYSAGLDGVDASAAPTPEVAALHARLAQLYRSRSVGADGAVERTYQALMAAEADLALAGLPADDPQRAELLQWQVEGLTLQLNDARDRRDWPGAFAVLERLATLPPGAVDEATLTETRRALIIQQALELLEEGDNDAAMQLAGGQVGAAELLPPANARPLFATWQVTATLSPARLGLVLTVQPTPGRAQEAQTALATLVQSWDHADQANEFTIVLEPAGTEPEAALQVSLTMPPGSGAAALARVTPPGADWALVRTLLAQLAPRIEQTPGVLNQQIRISQPLDLRSTYEQWTGVAATLDQQAEQFEAQSPNLNLADAETVVAETALVNRIKAANYRAGALAWRTLARNSLVAVQLSAGVGMPPVTRVWLATPETPLQTLTLEADLLSVGRLLVLAGVVLGAVFLLAGALWSML
jgi:hypothetical protein